MTPTSKRTVRLSSDVASRRAIVVVIGPGALIAFRLKGTRREYVTTVRACYEMAVRQEVQAERMRKAKARKNRP